MLWVIETLNCTDRGAVTDPKMGHKGTKRSLLTTLLLTLYLNS